MWHGNANAAMLPHTTVALRRRAPEALAALDDAAGVEIEALARRLANHAGAEQLRDLGVTEEALGDVRRRSHEAWQGPRRHAARAERAGGLPSLCDGGLRRPVLDLCTESIA